MAMMCTAALVEPPRAICTTAALRKAPRVRMRFGVKSSQIMATMRSPQSAAMRGWAASMAGMLVLPGRAMPSASAMAVMVLAVPMVLQVPGLRVMRASSCTHSSAPILPACKSSQNSRVCVPAPTVRPWWRSFSIGPAGQKRAGMPMLVAPISMPGVVLSQPPSSTAPSIGRLRSSSSVSMARKLRYSMVVGLTITSPRLMAGSSNGMPPASSTPRLTASARSRRCAWQGERSLQVLMRATMGRSITSSRRRPICCMRWRCAKPRMSLAANQRRLRSSAKALLMRGLDRPGGLLPLT